MEWTRPEITSYCFDNWRWNQWWWCLSAAVQNSHPSSSVVSFHYCSIQLWQQPSSSMASCWSTECWGSAKDEQAYHQNLWWGYVKWVMVILIFSLIRNLMRLYFTYGYFWSDRLAIASRGPLYSGSSLCVCLFVSLSLLSRKSAR